MLLAILPGCRDEAAPPELPPRAIQWTRVTAARADERRVISGIVTAVDDTRLAFDVAGTVEVVEVSLGDHVDEGQVLARLDPEPFEFAVLKAEAALAEAIAQRNLARVTLERTETAAERGAVRPQELSIAVADRDLRESQVAAAEARLGLAQRDLRRSVLVAPFAGTISVRTVAQAQKIAGGATVFEMDSEGGLRVEAQMPETLIARVRQGDKVVVGFPAMTDAQYPAVISEVGTRAGAGNAFPVRADLLSMPPMLRPGMTAEIAFSLPRGYAGLGELEGFLIPIAAAFAEAGDRFSVFVYDEETSTVNKRPIRHGGVLDNEIAVLEGLDEDDIIATAGVTFLHDGQPVSLLERPVGSQR
jgi:RND family efflux transporter MFP subunit